jgi:small redox-active disulfide protein 2
MKIEILGAGCANCGKLMALTEEAVRDLGVTDVELGKVDDFSKIAAYGVMTTPALAINGKVVVAGKVPSKAEITTLITSALATS